MAAKKPAPPRPSKGPQAKKGSIQKGHSKGPNPHSKDPGPHSKSPNPQPKGPRPRSKGPKGSVQKRPTTGAAQKDTINGPGSKRNSTGPSRGPAARKTDNFSKFYNKKRNSAVKEAFRQEKKSARTERKEAIERHFEQRRQTRNQQPRFGKAPFHPNQPPADKFIKPGNFAKPDKTQPGHNPIRENPHKEYPTKEHPSKETSNKEIPNRKNSHKENPIRENPPQNPPGAPSKNPFPIQKTASSTANGPTAARQGPADTTPHEQLPLNKYIAHAGICSRRDAAELVRQGKVTVNGQFITEPGTKVLPTDTIKVNGKKLTISRNFVYILLNKPKDFITTTDDPQGRKTVLDLIRQATTERVYPVGRLDRNTSGVLLLTNDGDLAQKLAHPSHQIKKIYHVTLDKALTKSDFDKIASGSVILEDGPAQVDAMAYAEPQDKAQIGLEIHSGRNRIVRRIFEHLGYDVRGLDRVMYAGLTKKNVQRGHWRLLTEKEIRILKYLNSSIKGSPARTKK